jgi:hypothetical protein
MRYVDSRRNNRRAKRAHNEFRAHRQVSRILALTIVEVMPESDSSRSRFHTCPRCAEPVYKVHRNRGDRLLSVLQKVRRYRCRSPACGWEGLLERPLTAPSFWTGLARRLPPWVIVGVLSIPLALILVGIYWVGARAWPSASSAESRQAALQQAPGESTTGVPLEPTDPRKDAGGILVELRRGCVWGGPGQHPYVGTLGDALIAAQLPSEIVDKLATMRESGFVTDRLQISAAGIHTADLRRDFGSTVKAMALDSTVCFSTRINLPIEIMGTGDLYELIDAYYQHYAIMVVTNGGNVALLEEQFGR